MEVSPRRVEVRLPEELAHGGDVEAHGERERGCRVAERVGREALRRAHRLAEPHEEPLDGADPETRAIARDEKRRLPFLRDRRALDEPARKKRSMPRVQGKAVDSTTLLYWTAACNTPPHSLRARPLAPFDRRTTLGFPAREASGCTAPGLVCLVVA